MAQPPPPPPPPTSPPPPPPPPNQPPGGYSPPPPPYQPPGGYSAPPPAFPPPAPGYGAYGGYQPPTDGMAITSLVLGVVAFPAICCYGVPGVAFGVTALILGRVALRKIRAANGMIGGHGLAQAGWICGLVAAVLGGLYALFYLLFVVLALFGTFNGGFPFFTPSPTG